MKLEGNYLNNNRKKQPYSVYYVMSKFEHLTVQFFFRTINNHQFLSFLDVGVNKCQAFLRLRTHAYDIIKWNRTKFNTLRWNKSKLSNEFKTTNVTCPFFQNKDFFV